MNEHRGRFNIMCMLLNVVNKSIDIGLAWRSHCAISHHNSCHFFSMSFRAAQSADSACFPEHWYRTLLFQVQINLRSFESCSTNTQHFLHVTLHPHSLFVGLQLVFWKPERQIAFWNTALQTSNFLQMQGCDWCAPYWHQSTLTPIHHFLLALAYINRPKNCSGISPAMPRLLPHPVRALTYNGCLMPQCQWGTYIHTVSTEKKTHNFHSVHKSLISKSLVCKISHFSF